MVGSDGAAQSPEELDSSARAQVVRALLDATVRQRPADEASAVAETLKVAERDLFIKLARPNEAECDNQILHAVFPLLAVIAG